MRHMPGLHALPTIDEQQLLPEEVPEELVPLQCSTP